MSGRYQGAGYSEYQGFTAGQAPRRETPLRGVSDDMSIDTEPQSALHDSDPNFEPKGEASSMDMDLDQEYGTPRTITKLSASKSPIMVRSCPSALCIEHRAGLVSP